MDTTLHAVDRRSRQFEVGPSSFENFDFGPGEPVPSGLALEPGWTLYCIDVERRQALFIEIPPEADLAAAPFVFSMQERLARRGLVVPFVALEDLARGVPAPQRIVLVFNIARCGSTLVNAMLNGVEGVWALSEPDPGRARPAVAHHLVGRAAAGRPFSAGAGDAALSPAVTAPQFLILSLAYAWCMFRACVVHERIPADGCRRNGIRHQGPAAPSASAASSRSVATSASSPGPRNRAKVTSCAGRRSRPIAATTPTSRIASPAPWKSGEPEAP